MKKTKQVFAGGRVFQSLTACCTNFGAEYRLVVKRLAIDWTLDEALGLKPWPGKREMVRRHRERKISGKLECQHRSAVFSHEQATGLRLCSVCDTSKPLSEFLSGCGTAHDRIFHCADCRSEHSRKDRFGLKPGEYKSILDFQGGTCAICRRTDSGSKLGVGLFVDHCHATGKVRGLLCSNCNAAIGNFKEDESVMLSAIEYLRSHADEG